MLWVHLALSHRPQAKVLVGTGLGLALPEEVAGVQEEEFLSKNLPAGPSGTDTASTTLSTGRAGTELWSELPSTGDSQHFREMELPRAGRQNPAVLH